MQLKCFLNVCPISIYRTVFYRGGGESYYVPVYGTFFLDQNTGIYTAVSLCSALVLCQISSALDKQVQSKHPLKFVFLYSAVLKNLFFAHSKCYNFLIYGPILYQDHTEIKRDENETCIPIQQVEMMNSLIFKVHHLVVFINVKSTHSAKNKDKDYYYQKYSEELKDMGHNIGQRNEYAS